MKILKVRIRNLNSLRLDKTIDFTASPLGDTGIFAIVGDTGSGKTTILDAITLALYGRIHRNESSREVPREVMTYGTGECLAECEFEATGGAVYRSKWSLHRARGKADGAFQQPRYELSKQNEKKDFDIIAEHRNEWQRQVEKITGLSYGQFCRSILLAQGDFAAFLRAGEQERSDLLEQITGTEYYTKISKASFQRWKIESDKLQRLHDKQDALSLLDETEVQLLKNQLNEQEKEAKESKSTLDNIKQNLLQLQKISTLEKRQLDTQTSLSEAQATQATAQRNFDRLAQHQVAAPLQADLRQLDELAAQQVTFKASAKRLQSNIADLEQQKSKQESKQQTLEQSWKKLQTNNEAQQRKFRQVTALDVQIQERQQQLEQLQKKAKAEKAKQATAEKSRAKQDKTATQLAMELAKSSTWLTQYEAYASLVTDLPKLELHIPLILSLKKQLEKLEKQQTKLKEQITTKTKELKKIKQRLERALGMIAGFVQDFEKKSERKYEKSAAKDYLNELRRQQERMTAYLNTLLNLKTQVEQLVQLEKQGKETKTQIESLEAQANAANRRLEQAKKQQVFKQEIHAQQQLILSYEERRAELNPGENCPLCLSSEQAFRTEGWKADFVNQAKIELAAAQKELEAQQNYQQKLLQELSEKKGRKEQLTEAWRGSKTQIEQLKIQAKEQAISAKSENLEELAALTQLIQNQSAYTESHQNNLKDLEEVHLLILAQEEAERAIESESKVLEAKIQGLEEQIELQAQQIQAATEKQHQHLAESTTILAQYKEESRLENLEKSYARLKQLASRYQEQSQTAEQQERSLKEIQQALVHAEKDIAERATVLTELAQNEAVQVKDLEILKAQRTELFGDKNPEKESQNWQKKLQDNEQKLQAARSENTQLQEQITVAQTKLQAIQQQLNANKQQGKQQQIQLLAAIQQLGFLNLQSLKNALLPAEEAKQIAQEKSRLEEQILTLNHSLKETKTELEALTRPSETNIEILELELKQQEQNHQVLQQFIGATRQQLQRNEQQKAQSKILLQQIDGQRKEHRRWEALKNLIGMESGKKFRVFAQGLTLQQLVHLANQHLEDLNERYFIQKRIGDDLTLEIIDRYQADNVRSMNTLSGGESFLVSLALALGLSDLAGQNTQIRSLFIDEGFGTLDEATLDTAIVTLENLQASGKTIGIISHVKALQERISTQIKVNKRGSGFSQLEIVHAF